MDMKLIIFFSSTIFHFSGSAEIKNPIILIPGLGCSRIDVKMDENANIRSKCKVKSNDYFTIWANIKYGATHWPKCIYDSLSLTYDKETHKTNNVEGIHTRIPGFGHTNTIESVTTIEFFFPYFKQLVQRMVKEGYVRGESIRGAPYDFRKGPTEQKENFDALKELIEKTYNENEQKKVVLIVHSLGGPMTLLFLEKQSEDWKKQYIRFIISLSGAWAGSVKALESYCRGFGFRGLEFMRKLGSKSSSDLPSTTPFPYIVWPKLSFIPKRLIRTWPGFLWMFPSLEAWKGTDVLVRIKDKSYSLENLKKFFDDLGESTGWKMYEDVKPFVDELPEPDVELHCLYGTGILTVASVYFKNNFWDKFRYPIHGDGDGAVNIQSLEVCTKWTNGKAKVRVTTKAFKGLHHSSILTDSKVLDHIIRLINNNN